MIHARRKINVLCRGLIQMSICILLMSVAGMAADTDNAPNGPIPATLFGLHMHKPMILKNQPWPTVPFGAGRLWDTGTYWAEINVAEGKYDWDLLDKWLARFHEDDGAALTGTDHPTVRSHLPGAGDERRHLVRHIHDRGRLRLGRRQGRPDR